MKKIIKKDNLFKIKPAARHILTIGRDLIKDNATAILELVKNSYDADATRVDIIFSSNSNKEISITINDNGSGMSYKTVTDVWMVPSTDYKHQKLRSDKKKRLLQGRKGIGRYASSILGDIFYLRTTKDGETTTLKIDWEEFEKNTYLEDVDILIEKTKTKEKNGTKLEIVGNEKHLLEWGDKQIDNLKRDLRRLISPIYEKEISNDFKIKFKFGNFPSENYSNKEIGIDPFPILEAFDYRIFGQVSEDGEAKLKFINDSIGGSIEDIFIKKINLSNGAKYCGKLKIDFKVYDQDIDSIDGLIQKISKQGNISDTGEAPTRAQARALLKEITGISVYKNGFRVRPHGDPGYDWLQLDRRRVQNPGMRLGSDRVSGFIEIDSDEKSNLEEKANREGLKENYYYAGLVQIAQNILQELEDRRYKFKLKTGQQKSGRNINERLEKVFDFSDVTEKINKELSDNDIPEPEIKKITKLIDDKVEESNKVIDDVKNIIAIYQGQATLGKIVKVVLHEGKNPISYLQNQTPNIENWINKLKEKFDKTILEKLVDSLGAFKYQITLLTTLFNKISPLAVRRQTSPKNINIKKAIEDVVDIFSFEIKEKGIKVKVDIDNSAKVLAWQDDVSHVFANLLDNSIYWLSGDDLLFKEILISGSVIDDSTLKIVYTDSGPGINEKYIEDGLIFEPGFSTKTDGTGLGLSIAGDAIERSSGKIMAVYSDDGARFELFFKLSE